VWPRRKRKAPPLDRNFAMRATPRPLPVLKREEGKPDELRLTAAFERPGWQRRLGADRQCRRTFVLDALGREVYEYCNGDRDVGDIVRLFSERHHVSAAEAEYSVTTYLKTLMAKGLLAMEVQKGDG
jgi:hypothetical protein